jgi:flagellar motility protein MotE (MotC chaperone)
MIWKGEIQNMQMANLHACLDKISTKLIKQAGDILSLKRGIIPDDWKFAKVNPIYKSEDKTLCKTYRTMSIISNIAKIFEKLNGL